MYTVSVSADRPYQLQSSDANRRIDALLEYLRVPEGTWRLYGEMLTTVLKMFEDGAGIADLRIAHMALKEMRYGFKVFAPYRQVPKVTVFGSARTLPVHAISAQAYGFGKRMIDAGWMVITGAGSGVMGAAQEGAGRERSFGLNIRLPSEQEANPWIADDPKLISFKYFFTRKLFLVREAHAMAFFPGGFGTCDEVFEALTLTQTGKQPVLPVVLVDENGGTYWKRFAEFIRAELVGKGMISAEDTGLFRITDDLDEAVAEILDFYRVYHSQRYVGGNLIFRLRRALSVETLADLNGRFGDILDGRAEQSTGPLKAENGEFPELPRLVLPFNRASFSRIRQVIDFVNRS
jgi:uncharacterized protein (TIGR00730 family)